MQEASDEGHEGAGSTEAAGSSRLGQDSYRVELVGGGWAGSIGHCTQIYWERTRNDGGVEWERVASPAFIFSQSAALLVLQGMKLSDLFPADVRFVLSHLEPYAGPRGPFVLLKGTLSTPGSPPLRIRDMVLAHIREVPKGMTRPEVLAALLRAVA
jgi:hypothetical protein